MSFPYSDEEQIELLKNALNANSYTYLLKN